MERHTKKLAQLRARTDRQLLELISAKLDHGFHYARVLAARESRSARAELKEFEQRAEAAWREVNQLLPALGGIDDATRAALTRRAGILREVLDQFAADAYPIRRAAGF
jgi:hypothetical protein